MADEKITGLTELTTIADADLFVVVDVSDTVTMSAPTGADKFSLASTVADYVRGGIVVIPSTSFRVLNGSPSESITHNNLTHCWLHDPSNGESVGTFVRLPGWSTVTFQVVWAASSADAGDVVWEIGRVTIADGALPSGSNVNITSAASGVTNETIVSAASSAVVVPAGEFFGVRVNRRAGDAGDTYPADAKFMALLINKAS